MKELICIQCPNGCHLQVYPEKEYTVTGNKCAAGAKYGKDELLHPVRVVTTTVKTADPLCPRLPVKTDRPVEKARMMDVMALLDGVTVSAPLHCGDVILPNIFGTDVNIVACKDLL